MVVEDQNIRNISDSSMSSSSSSRAAALKRKNVKIAEKVSTKVVWCLRPVLFCHSSALPAAVCLVTLARCLVVRFSMRAAHHFRFFPGRYKGNIDDRGI